MFDIGNYSINSGDDHVLVIALDMGADVNITGSVNFCIFCDIQLKEYIYLCLKGIMQISFPLPFSKEVMQRITIVDILKPFFGRFCFCGVFIRDVKRAPKNSPVKKKM